MELENDFESRKTVCKASLAADYYANINPVLARHYALVTLLKKQKLNKKISSSTPIKTFVTHSSTMFKGALMRTVLLAVGY